ncbi:hypothetical protein ACSMXN_07290 [Jatrophihabitans sp. DSM 45814]
MPRFGSRSWWVRVFRDALVAGFIVGYAFRTQPAQLHVSDRVGVALAVLAGAVIGLAWVAFWQQDLVDRLCGPAVGVLATALLLLLPFGEARLSVLGFGLTLGIVAGAILTDAASRGRATAA